MTHSHRFAFFCLVASTLCSAGLARGQAGDPAVLQQKLNAQFKLTRTTADRTDIVTAGDVVEIHQPGIVMFGAGEPIGPTNVYKQGRITQGFGTQMLMSGKDRLVRRFVPGEKCWVVQVAVENDGVAIGLYSDPYNDTHYYGTLKIAYPDKKTVPPVDAFLKTVAEVLTVVQQDDQGGQQQQGGQQPQGVEAAPPPPAAAPLPAIAPPPPPPDAPPPTIAIGQTVLQVTTAFGQPTRIAKLGAKEIYYYKDMKVTFTNGKVSNVE
jgi:hypothetical protein